MNDLNEGLGRILSEHKFFNTFSPEHIALIAGCAENVVFRPGEYLFRQGQPADHLYLIREGLVSLELSAAGKGTVVLTTAGRGEVVGWSWIVAPHRWRYSGKATKVTRAISLRGDCIKGKCEKDYELGYRFLNSVVGVLAHRLEAARIQLLDIYGTETRKGGS